MVCFQGDSVSVKEMFLIGRILYFLTKLTANAIFFKGTLQSENGRPEAIFVS